MAALVLAGIGVAAGGAWVAMQLRGEGATVLAAPAAPALGGVSAVDNGRINWDSPASVVAASIRYAMAPDPDRFRATLYASDADEQRLADALAEVFVNAQELNDLAKARFGPEARLGLVGSRDDMPKPGTTGWQVQVEGDTAIVNTPRGMNPRVQRLRRVDGKWKVCVYETMGPAIKPGLSAAELADRMTVTAAAMDRTASGILEGRLTTADEAARFLWSQTRRLRSAAPGQ